METHLRICRAFATTMANPVLNPQVGQSLEIAIGGEEDHVHPPAYGGKHHINLGHHTTALAKVEIEFCIGLGIWRLEGPDFDEMEQVLQ